MMNEPILDKLYLMRLGAMAAAFAVPSRPERQRFVDPRGLGIGGVLTDIFGATPSNLALKLLEPGRFEGIAGVNLPMLLRALTYRERGMETLLTRAIAGGRDGVLNMQD